MTQHQNGGAPLTPNKPEDLTDALKALEERHDAEKAKIEDKRVRKTAELTVDLMWLTGINPMDLQCAPERLDALKDLVSHTEQFKARMAKALKSDAPLRHFDGMPAKPRPGDGDWDLSHLTPSHPFLNAYMPDGKPDRDPSDGCPALQGLGPHEFIVHGHERECKHCGRFERLTNPVQLDEDPFATESWIQHPKGGGA